MIQFVDANTNQRDVQELNNSVARVFDSLYSNPLLNNPTLVSDIVFTSGVDTTISHKLGRVPKGYIVVKANAAAHVYTSSTALTTPNTQIILKTNANATISLLFF